MFAFFGGASLKIARNLIQVTGLKESLALFQKNNFSNIGESEVLKLLLAVDACNLIQTMKEDFIAKEIGEEDLQDAVEDYLVENLKGQAVMACRDGAERMDQCQEILKVAAKFQEYWTREDTKDPGPRFYCVKELLKRLNCEANTPIHDNLFEFVYQQHNRFIRYFKTLLEPFRTEGSPEPIPEQPLAIAMHIPVTEPLPRKAAGLETVYPESQVPAPLHTPSPAWFPAGTEADSPEPLLENEEPPKSDPIPQVPEPLPEEDGNGEDAGEKTAAPELPALEPEDPEEATEEFQDPMGTGKPIEEDPEVWKPSKAPSYRPLNMMDTLSGFPLMDSPRGKAMEMEDAGEKAAAPDSPSREPEDQEAEKVMEGGKISLEWEGLTPLESIFPFPTQTQVPGGPLPDHSEDLLEDHSRESGPPAGGREADQPTSKMLEDLFDKVNPIDPNESKGGEG